MSLLARPAVASAAAKALQRSARMVQRAPLERFPEFPRDTRELTIPNSVAQAPAVVYALIARHVRQAAVPKAPETG